MRVTILRRMDDGARVGFAVEIVNLVVSRRELVNDSKGC